MPQPLKVLIAEDNPADAELVLRELRRSGFEPDWQRVESEAAFREQLHPGLDLVLSDFQMPQFNGIRALELLQQSGLLVPFILVSGTIGEDTAVEAMRLGAADYLLKDRLSRLGEAVRRVVGERRVRDARRRADAELRESEERFAQAFEQAPNGVALVSPDGRWLKVNRAVCELVGYSEAELLAGTFQAITHPADLALDLENLRQVLAGERRSYQIEKRYIHRRGHSVTVLLNVSLVRDDQGEPRYFIAQMQDITANKAAELALRESEERFKFVARAVSDVVWDWDLAANTLWWNDGFLTTFGFAAGEIAPSVESWTGRIHPEDRRRVTDGIRRAIDTGQEFWSADYRIQRKDGTHASVHDRGYILRDAAGKGLRMVGGMRDLTAEKKLEAQYLRAQRMESIGTLASGIAHDLNNVLAPIMMSIELLKLDAGLDPPRARILDTIQASSQRGADLVRQVLSFAQGLDGQVAVIQLRHLVNELEGIITQTFPRNIRISTEVPADLWPFTGDPTQLHQVLLNLAVNARDAMPRGGTLTINASNVTLPAPGPGPEAKPGPHVLLQVTDTGTGIPPEVREKIFEPFFTTKERGKGTGLGLATVHTIIKSHGGFLQVESEVGHGTTFKIYLPANPAQSRVPSAHPLQIDLPRGRGELVLVVDDEFSIRHITQKTLEAFGYQVLTAGDGTEAVALYARHLGRIAVVLTDLMMPAVDGASTCQMLRRIDPAVRLIVASGIESGDTTDLATRAGVQDCLLKPYSAETLLKLIREVIDRPAAPLPG